MRTSILVTLTVIASFSCSGPLPCKTTADCVIGDQCVNGMCSAIPSVGGGSGTGGGSATGGGTTTSGGGGGGGGGGGATATGGGTTTGGGSATGGGSTATGGGGGATGCTPNTECRGRAGDCDLAETCLPDGTCPVDAFLPNDTLCRAAADGGCDLEERCDGLGAQCPANVLQPAVFECRPAVNACDLAETCDGVGVVCPSDVIQASTFQCAPQMCMAGTTMPARFCAAGTVPDCLPVTAVSCNGFQCDGTTTCRTNCGSNADCQSTHFCQAGGLCAPKRPDGTSCTSAATGNECVSGVCAGSYPDADGDGFGAGLMTFVCGATLPPNRSTTNNDCCDSDTRAKPGQTAFFTTARTTCGGFDFNCDGSQSAQFGGNACQTEGACADGSRFCNGDTGFSGTAPACGVSATYVSVCNESNVCSPATCPGCTICNPTTTTRTQACR